MALTPKEHAIADAATSAAMGLPPQEHGLLFCVDDDGARWTAVTDDAEFVRMLAEADAGTILADLELPADKFPIKRAGWPDDWTQDG